MVPPPSFNDLPPELLREHILPHVTGYARGCLRSTCKKWRDLVDDKTSALQFFFTDQEVEAVGKRRRQPARNGAGAGAGGEAGVHAVTAACMRASRTRCLTSVYVHVRSAPPAVLKDPLARSVSFMISNSLASSCGARLTHLGLDVVHGDLGPRTRPSAVVDLDWLPKIGRACPALVSLSLLPRSGPCRQHVAHCDAAGLADRLRALPPTLEHLALPLLPLPPTGFRLGSHLPRLQSLHVACAAADTADVVDFAMRCLVPPTVTDLRFCEQLPLHQGGGSGSEVLVSEQPPIRWEAPEWGAALRGLRTLHTPLARADVEGFAGVLMGLDTPLPLRSLRLQMQWLAAGGGAAEAEAEAEADGHAQALACVLRALERAAPALVELRVDGASEAALPDVATALTVNRTAVRELAPRQQRVLVDPCPDVLGALLEGHSRDRIVLVGRHAPLPCALIRRLMDHPGGFQCAVSCAGGLSCLPPGVPLVGTAQVERWSCNRIGRPEMERLCGLAVDPEGNPMWAAMLRIMFLRGLRTLALPLCVRRAGERAEILGVDQLAQVWPISNGVREVRLVEGLTRAAPGHWDTAAAVSLAESLVTMGLRAKGLSPEPRVVVCLPAGGRTHIRWVSGGVLRSVQDALRAVGLPADMLQVELWGGGEAHSSGGGG